MTTNHFFKNFNSFPQQELLNSLTREVIQMSGLDVLYLPRKNIKKDDILNEDPLSKFESAFEIEMYVNVPDGFGGVGDISTKFGLDVQDELILIVNKERFLKETVLSVPKEGDLIYFPLDKNIFEIKFVEHEKPFYSMGKNTVFEMTCEKYVFSEEKFEIPIASSGVIFDKFERENAITIQITVAAGSSVVYTKDEEVYQGVSLVGSTAKGIVADFNSTTNIMNIFNTVGTFATGINIIGATSATTRNVTKVDDQTISSSEYSDNSTYETDGDGILDFSEVDPWSEGDL
jgi:hypothetical protein